MPQRQWTSRRMSEGAGPHIETTSYAPKAVDLTKNVRKSWPSQRNDQLCHKAMDLTKNVRKSWTSHRNLQQTQQMRFGYKVGHPLRLPSSSTEKEVRRIEKHTLHSLERSTHEWPNQNGTQLSPSEIVPAHNVLGISFVCL